MSTHPKTSPLRYFDYPLTSTPFSARLDCSLPGAGNQAARRRSSPTDEPRSDDAQPSPPPGQCIEQRSRGQFDPREALQSLPWEIVQLEALANAANDAVTDLPFPVGARGASAVRSSMSTHSTPRPLCVSCPTASPPPIERGLSSTPRRRSRRSKRRPCGASRSTPPEA